MAETDKPQPESKRLSVWRILAILVIVVVLVIVFLALIGPYIGRIYSDAGPYI